MAKASGEFQIFAKPVGAICNLACRYCYYLDKARLYPDDRAPRMTDAVLEEYIVQHIAASSGPQVVFSWHGGEPTLLGVDFYRKAVDLQLKHKPAGWVVRNGMQTNGVSIDEAWGQFLAAERFHVGLSLDGPAELHDAYRVNKGGQPTHHLAMRGYELLRGRGVPLDVLCAVHSVNVTNPLAVYRFFRRIGARYVGFLPVVEPAPETDSGVSEHTPSAADFGTFLCKIFDEWIARDVDRIGVQYFEEAARPAAGLDHSLCIFRQTCGQIPTVEHNGDFYSCDHYVDAAHRIGNIRETPLGEMLDSPAQRAFGDAKRDALPRYCRGCDVLAMCHGHCPKYRFIHAPDGEPGLNYLCAGLKRFFMHSREPLARLVANGREQATTHGRRKTSGETIHACAAAARNSRSAVELPDAHSEAHSGARGELEGIECAREERRGKPSGIHHIWERIHEYVFKKALLGTERGRSGGDRVGSQDVGRAGLGEGDSRQVCAQEGVGDGKERREDG